MYYIPRNCTEVKLFCDNLYIISYECYHEYFFNTIFLCTTKEGLLITKVSST